LQISLGIEEELDSKKERQYVQHIPVYLAKNRAIVHERRQVLEQVFKIMTPEVRKKILGYHQKHPLLLSRPHFARRFSQEIKA